MDEFVVTIPREPTFSVVADLVVGGIASRSRSTRSSSTGTRTAT
jgi:hypothetical protein